jgi:hypothetical protein
VQLTGGAELAVAEGRGARVRGCWAAWAAKGGSAGEREREREDLGHGLNFGMLQLESKK